MRSRWLQSEAQTSLSSLSAMCQTWAPSRQQTSLHNNSGQQMVTSHHYHLLSLCMDAWLRSSCLWYFPRHGFLYLVCNQGTEPILPLQTCRWRRSLPPTVRRNKLPVLGVSICPTADCRLWLLLLHPSQGFRILSFQVISEDLVILSCVFLDTGQAAHLLPQLLNLAAQPYLSGACRASLPYRHQCFNIQSQELFIDL